MTGALDLLEIAIENRFDSLWLVFNKALALREMGDLAGAIACWEGLAQATACRGLTR